MSSPARPGSRTPRRQEPAEEAPRTPRTPRTPRQQRNVEEEPRTPRTPRTPRQPARATPARAGPSTGTPRGTPGRFATPSKTPGKNVPGSGRPGSRSSRSDSSAFTPQRAQRQPNGGGMVIDASDSNPPSSSPAVRDRASSPLGYVGGMSEIDLSSPLNYGTPSSMGSIRTPRSGVRGTPIRLRPDIRTDKRIRQINIQPPGSGEPREASSQPSSEPDAAQEPGLVIWGTDVSVSRCKERFKLFVETFIEPNTDQDERLENMDDSQPLYIQKLEEVNFLEDPFLNLNCAHLESFDATLARQLICYPQEVIPILDMAINEMFFEKHPAAVLSHQIQIRPFNTHMTKDMRSLNPEDVDQLITLTGMVIRTSNTIPEMREAFFKCMACDFTTSVEIDRGRIAEPTLCTNCNTNHCFGLIHNRSQFTDKQMVKLQESPDDMPAGQTPHTIVLYAHNDLVDAVLPGDRVYVTGIYRAIPIKVNPRMSSVRASTRHTSMTSLRLTPERIELLKSLSEKADVYDRLSRAIAPSIFGNEDIKKGILLQLFGGTKKNFSSEGRGHFRAENIIIINFSRRPLDTRKSQLRTLTSNN
ncbi:unnamed protein product [Bemisia tabaci]|uniref:DNA replication licensing factor MCM4 n=1 Tax=Bemisia tabaci TaxID=7038 RepID=A0A9P0APH3_BEMTA|nr:unnamed protein product [Bemisia tabaci]